MPKSVTKVSRLASRPMLRSENRRRRALALAVAKSPLPILVTRALWKFHKPEKFENRLLGPDQFKTQEVRAFFPGVNCKASILSVQGFLRFACLYT